MAPQYPNLLVITCHDLGDTLGCYGTPIHTPNLDAIAGQGALLENHFAPASICSPARGSLWTGCYPHTHGLMGLMPRGWQVDVDRCPPLPALLKDAGYESHLFGVQHEHWDPRRLGYDAIHDLPSEFCDDVTPAVVDWLRARADADAPFLAAVGFFDPHRIGLASQGYRPDLLNQPPSHFWRDVYTKVDPAAVEVPPFLLDTPVQRAELADFYAAIQFVDRQIGVITRTLDETGLADNTLLMFVIDHGASFLHSKGTLYDGGTKVACMVRWPGVIPAGQRVAGLTSHVDIVPTLLELLDLPTPAHVEGQSLADVLRGGDAPTRDYVFAEKNYTQYFDPQRMVRSERFKYIRRGIRSSIFDFVLTELEMSAPSFRNNKDVFGFYSCARRTEEFYDLDADPAELHNLAEDPAYADTLNALRAALDRHLDATADPFRDLRISPQMPPDVYAEMKRASRAR
ncbi:sulfatase family protein [Aggregatilinea lenta]|uniref:sulfatase family protein n=1 Tax=Aggregatilinea lenta TaxID=913108 RepID=UPI000E5B97D3|nr:sulfatase [Aggregatilinea lenta]